MDFIQINGIQHFVFCKRQWALIQLEQAWDENEDTILGQHIHRNVDDEYYHEKRKGRIYVRSMPIVSYDMMISGIADMVEYKKDSEGVNVSNYKGRWKPYVIEYKKGKPKRDDSDISQLVAQVMCIEEMASQRINESAIYYKSTNKRVIVDITDDRRDRVRSIVLEMHECIKNKQTPKAEFCKKCQRCSLKELCVPRLTGRKKSVVNYLNEKVLD